MSHTKTKFILGLASMLILTSCGGGGGSPAASSSASIETSSAEHTSSETSSASSSDTPREDLAEGVFNYSGADNQTRTELLAALESYAMQHHLAGIPLYDDASYQQFSNRITLKSEKYIPNYGFGVGESSLDPTKTMYNGMMPDTERAEWKSYFHDYTTVDSGTFNFWNSTGSDVSSRNGMITSGYFEVEMTSDKTDYQWKGGLSKTDAPIMLDAEGNEIEYAEGATSRFWRIKLKTGADGLKYTVPETSKWFGEFDGLDVALEDYLTPFKALLDNRLARWTELAQDSSGFAGVSTYVYGGKHDEEAWSKVGIQVNKEEGSMDFEFISPKTRSYAMTNLSSGLYSPVPASFISKIGGATRFGQRGTGADYTKVLDNIISVGPYVPEYWQENKSLVYKRNPRYYDIENIHYDGVSEAVFTGTDAEKQAYQAFLANQLDEVTIPSSFLKDHKNDPNVYRTLGSSILKMNVNSCTEEEWEYFFGENGTMSSHRHKKDNYWDVKPIMSNDDFLDGFFFAIDRKTLAEDAGRNPAIGYLGNGYMMDPDGRQAYRDTDEGKGVVQEYIDAAGNDYCYNKALAQDLFNSAIHTLMDQGALEEDTEIELICYYRYQETIDNVGKDLKNSVEDAFNTCDAAQSFSITLNLNLQVAGTQYTDCYSKMDNGDYDFAEGAVVGNALNPLEFMNTVCTNAKSQGFCLNWGEITEKVNMDDPLMWDGMAWSYDALWSSANSFSIVESGVLREISSNPRYEFDGTTIDLVSDYAELFDEWGEPLFEFGIVNKDAGRPALLYSTTSEITSGVYLSADQYSFEAENGELRFKLNYESARSELAGQNYFCIQYTLVYTYDDGTGLVTAYKDIYLIAKLSDVVHG